MYTDDEPTRGLYVPGINRDTTLGEIANLVGDRDILPTNRHLAIETITADGIDQENAIRDGIRARRMPFLAGIATCATGYGAWWCVESIAAADPAALGTVWAATALSLPLMRAVFRNRIPEAWRRRWWLAGGAAVAWIDVASALGPSWPLTGALLLGGIALSARHYDENEVPNPSEAYQQELPAPEPRPAIDSSRATQIEQAWYARVAAGRNPVAKNSRLTDRTELPNGTRWTVELDRDGSVRSSSLQRNGEDIARAMGVAESHVIIEGGATADLSTLTVVTHDLLADGVPYDGPEYHDGRIPVGLYADGTGRAEWIAWEWGQGVRNGLASGEMGSGKTALLELVGLGLRSSGCWRVWWGDGDPEGSSSNLMDDVAHWDEAGAEGLLRQLAAFEALLDARAKIKHLLTEDPTTGWPAPRTSDSQPKLREFKPSPHYPGYMWLLPEFYTICQDPKLSEEGFVSRFETALRRSRKFGLGAAVDTQSALGGDFKGSTTLRSFLQSRNAFVMRTTNRSEQHVVNGLTVSPGTLKPGGGYGFVPGRGRAPMMRTAWTPDLHHWVPSLPECNDDPDAALVIAPFLPPALADDTSALAEKQAEVEQWRAALRRGEHFTPAATKPPTARVSVGGVAVPAPLGGKVLPMRRPDVQPTPVSQPGEVSPRAGQVLATLRSRPGAWRSAELIEATSLSASVVSKALAELVGHGLAHRPNGVQGIHAAGPGTDVRSEHA